MVKEFICTLCKMKYYSEDEILTHFYLVHHELVVKKLTEEGKIELLGMFYAYGQKVDLK